jgi:hypothetical protein
MFKLKLPFQQEDPSGSQHSLIGQSEDGECETPRRTPSPKKKKRRTPRSSRLVCLGRASEPYCPGARDTCHTAFEECVYGLRFEYAFAIKS